jgi:hypothetical protein
MFNFLKKLTPFVFVSMFVLACSENTTTTDEKVEIRSMDSTSKVLKDNTGRLEDQTKKVEASLEKLDNEFENDN